MMTPCLEHLVQMRAFKQLVIGHVSKAPSMGPLVKNLGANTNTGMLQSATVLPTIRHLCHRKDSSWLQAPLNLSK